MRMKALGPFYNCLYRKILSIITGQISFLVGGHERYKKPIHNIPTKNKTKRTFCLLLNACIAAKEPLVRQRHFEVLISDTWTHSAKTAGHDHDCPLPASRSGSCFPAVEKNPTAVGVTGFGQIVSSRATTTVYVYFGRHISLRTSA